MNRPFNTGQLAQPVLTASSARYWAFFLQGPLEFITDLHIRIYAIRIGIFMCSNKHAFTRIWRILRWLIIRSLRPCLVSLDSIIGIRWCSCCGRNFVSKSRTIQLVFSYIFQCLEMAIAPTNSSSRGFQTQWIRMQVSNLTHGCTWTCTIPINHGLAHLIISKI